MPFATVNLLEMFDDGWQKALLGGNRHQDAGNSFSFDIGILEQSEICMSINRVFSALLVFWNPFYLSFA